MTPGIGLDRGMAARSCRSMVSETARQRSPSGSAEMTAMQARVAEGQPVFGPDPASDGSTNSRTSAHAES